MGIWLSVLIDGGAQRERTIGTQIDKHALTRTLQESATPLYPTRFVYISLQMTFVAGRGHEDTTWTRHAGNGLMKELVFVPKRLMRTLAERHHTGLAHAGGIVENVLKTKRVGCRRILIIILFVDEHGVFGHGIADQTKVALPCHAPIIGIVARTGCNACRVRAVGNDRGVARTGTAQNSSLGLIIGSYIKTAPKGISRQLIPETADAIVG